MTKIKICGLRDLETLDAALKAGADFIGLVFYALSPRYVDIATAGRLASLTPAPVQKVGLFVDVYDQELLHIVSSVPLDMIQLHGDESPARVAEIAALSNLPVMKAIRVRGAADMDDAAAYEDVCDWLLFDSKIDGDLPGGTGQRFDWEILKGRTFKKPWMLSGGLTPENVSSALEILTPNAVDVSSGVEVRRSIKDPAKIAEFVEAVRRPD